jgi:hypothetical protein
VLFELVELLSLPMDELESCERCALIGSFVVVSLSIGAETRAGCEMLESSNTISGIMGDTGSCSEISVAFDTSGAVGWESKGSLIYRRAH